MMGSYAVQRLLLADLELVGDGAPVRECDQAGHVVVRQRLSEVIDEGVLYKLRVLVLVRGVEQELGVDDPELLVILVDAALANN